MIHFISSRLQHTRHIASITCHVYLFSTSSVNPILSSSNSTDLQSLTVSYLLNSCGLSFKSAISASKKLQFQKTEQPDSVLNLLKTNGLTQTHIKILITNHPLILLADPHKTLKPNIELFESLGLSGTNLVKVLKKHPRVLETDAHTIVGLFKTYGFSKKQISSLTMKLPSLYSCNLHKNIKPKLEYFKSLGFSDPEMAKMLSSVPNILERSLENQIIPSVQVIRRIVGTNEDVLKAIKARYQILKYNLKKVLEPNIAILLDHGVPKSNVRKLFMIDPKSLHLGNRFNEVVSEVEKMGFDPTTFLFVLAIRTISVMSKSHWEHKLEVFSSFGLSEDDIISAFKLQPMCMLASEEKIRKVMGFFTNQLKLKPKVISKSPILLQHSLEKWIVPRCSVLQLLMTKNLIKGDMNLIHALKMPEKIFAGRFVSMYQDVIPEVVQARQGKIQFQGFPITLRT